VGPSADEIYTVATTEAGFAPAVLIAEPAPRYAPVLQEIGLSGRVVPQFVVDTTGHVELASIHVLQSTHGRASDSSPTNRASMAAARSARDRIVRRRCRSCMWEAGGGSRGDRA